LPLHGWHREDIKAVLRKRYGSVHAFELRKGLPKDSVSDVLRGRTAGKTIAAITDEMNKAEGVSE
jgi:lambda repressor-like predicted transcriptional regulator